MVSITLKHDITSLETHITLCLAILSRQVGRAVPEESIACCSSCQCTPVVEVPSMSSARCLPTAVTTNDPFVTSTTEMMTRTSQQLPPFVLTLPNLSALVPGSINLQTAVVPLMPIDISGMTAGTPTPIEFVVDPGFQFQGKLSSFKTVAKGIP